jgi:hypothetical protein
MQQQCQHHGDSIEQSHLIFALLIPMVFIEYGTNNQQQELASVSNTVRSR